jgi:hypothetical protein
MATLWFTGAAVVVVGGCWGVFLAMSHFNLVGSMRLAAAQHEQSTGGRPQVPWVFLNLSDFAQGMGLPLAVTSFAAMWPTTTSSSESPRTNVLSVALWSSILALDLSGIVRGEVSRLWMMLMPIGLVAIALEIARRRAALGAIGALAIGQAVCSFFILRYWRGFTP